MPVGSDLAGPLHHPVWRRRGWPELQEVVVGLRVLLHPRVQFPTFIHPCGAVTDPVAGPSQVERPVLLATPADQRSLAHRLHRDLNHLLPPLPTTLWPI